MIATAVEIRDSVDRMPVDRLRTALAEAGLLDDDTGNGDTAAGKGKGKEKGKGKGKVMLREEMRLRLVAELDRQAAEREERLEAQENGHGSGDEEGEEEWHRCVGGCGGVGAAVWVRRCMCSGVAWCWCGSG